MQANSLESGLVTNREIQKYIGKMNKKKANAEFNPKSLNVDSLKNNI
jgi:hypothetical protein